MIELHPSIIPNDLKKYFKPKRENGPFICRNVIVWHKPNAMPSSVKDRFTVDFEYLFFFVKNRKYYFEQQFEPHKHIPNLSIIRTEVNYKPEHKKGYHDGSHTRKVSDFYGERGRNKRTVWTINTKPFPEAHFAVYPKELIETPIKAGCPEYICKKCGKPRESIIETIYPYKRENVRNKKPREDIGRVMQEVPEKGWQSIKKVIGKTDCGCNVGFEPGTVLDPFAGAGTTGMVAKKLNRNFIGFEISKEYVDIANKRLKKYDNRGIT